MNLIYLDNNATTPMLPAVAEAMRPYLTEVYGQPGQRRQQLAGLWLCWYHETKRRRR